MASKRMAHWLGSSLVVVAWVSVFAQSPLAQLNVGDAAAREWLQKVVLDAGPDKFTPETPQAFQVLATFKKLPAATRGPLTTQLYAWAKGVLVTPAFKASFAKRRDDERPVEIVHKGTVDDELKAVIADKTAEMETGWKQLESMGNKDLADAAAKQRKEWPAQVTQLTPSWKEEIVEKRQHDKDEYTYIMKVWGERYPADPNVRIATILKEFLDTTADVDYAAKQHMEAGEVRTASHFDNPAYEAKPWQWQTAYACGPEAIAAARTAAAAWLKELGK